MRGQMGCPLMGRIKALQITLCYVAIPSWYKKLTTSLRQETTLANETAGNLATASVAAGRDGAVSLERGERPSTTKTHTHPSARKFCTPPLIPSLTKCRKAHIRLSVCLPMFLPSLIPPVVHMRSVWLASPDKNVEVLSGKSSHTSPWSQPADRSGQHDTHTHT